MDLRVFFYRKFVVGQGRERSIAREFLEKNEKSKKKHLLCYRENVGANIVRPRQPGAARLFREGLAHSARARASNARPYRVL